MAEIPIATQAGDQAQAPDLPPTNGLNAVPAYPEQDDDTHQLRGIIALSHKRGVLFKDEVELDVERLPRWRPHISVDERRLSNDDHE